MEGRGVIVAAVVGVLALAGIGAFLFAGGGTGEDVGERAATPDLGSDGVAMGADGYEPPPVPGEAAPAKDGEGAVLEAPAEDNALQLPPDATPEDGGLAYGSAVCDKLIACGCETRTHRQCAHNWRWVQPEDWDTVKCLLDLSCQDACRHGVFPKDVACLAAMGDLRAEDLGGERPWEHGRPLPGWVDPKSNP